MSERQHRPRRPVLEEATRFVLVGLENPGIGLAAILLLQALTPAGPYLANAGGYAVGLGVSFVLNRGWTFRSASKPLVEAGRFLIAFAVCRLANLTTLHLLIEGGLSPYAAQSPAIVISSVAFFLLSRRLVFR